MENKTTRLSDSATDKASTIGGKVSDSATHMKDKISDFGHTAADAIDNNRGAAAGGLEKAASTLRENAESLPGGEKVSHLAHSAADKLSSTAGYVREHDANQMMADVERLVKNNPGPSVLAAAAIGFLVGRAFRND